MSGKGEMKSAGKQRNATTQRRVALVCSVVFKSTCQDYISHISNHVLEVLGEIKPEGETQLGLAMHSRRQPALNQPCCGTLGLATNIRQPAIILI